MRVSRARRTLTAGTLAAGLVAGALPGSGLLVGVAAAGNQLRVAPISAPDTADPFTLTASGLSSHQGPTVQMQIAGPGKAGSASVSGGAYPSSNTTLSADGGSATSSVGLRASNGTPLGPGTYTVLVCDNATCTSSNSDQGSLYVYAPRPISLTGATGGVAAPGSTVAFSVTGTSVTTGAQPQFFDPSGAPTGKVTLHPKALTSTAPAETWTPTTYSTKLDVASDAAPGQYQVALADTAGTTSNRIATFTVTPPLTASSVAPNAVGRGARRFPVLVSGSGFRPTTTATVLTDSTSGMTDSSTSAVTQFVSATQLRVLLTVDPSASTGSRDLNISNSDDGQSADLPLTIVAAPDLTTASLAVSGKAAGSTVSGQTLGRGAGSSSDSGPFTITLSRVRNVSSGPVTVDLGPGVDPGAVSASTDPTTGLTTITAAGVRVASDAPLGAHPITVTDGSTGGVGPCPSANGTPSSACTLTVTAAPVPTSVDPGSVGRSAPPTTLTVSGTGFPTSTTTSTAHMLVVVGKGLSTVVTPSSSSSATAAGYDPTKEPGSGLVPVTLTNAADGGAATCTTCFAVDAFTLDNATLGSGGQAAPNDPAAGPLTITATGSGIPADAQLQLVHDPGVPDQAVIVGTGTAVTPTTIRANFDLRNAAPGFHLLRAVSSADPTQLATCACSLLAKPTGSSYGHLIVTADPPTVASVAPNAVAQGATSFPLTVTGTNFFPGMTAAFNGSGVTVDQGSVHRTSITTLTMTVTVDPGAALGTRDLTVTAADGYSATKAGAITVNAAPTLTSVSPTALGQGARATVTVKGTGLSGTTRFDFGPKTSAGTPTVVDASTVTVPVSVAGDTPVGGHDVTAKNADGGVATLSKGLTVNAGPAISSVSPNLTGRRVAFDLVLTGAHFSTDAQHKPAVEVGTYDGSTFTPDSAITADPATVNANGTSATTRVTVGQNAALGAHAIRITNPDLGSALCTGCLNVIDPPSAPQSVTARPGDGQVLVSWSPPASDGGAAVSSYTVDCTSTANGGEVHEATLPGDATQAVVSSPARKSQTETVPFTNGTPYRCAVTATNSGGTSPGAAASPVTPTASERLQSVTPTQVYAGTIGRAPAPAPKPATKTRKGKARRAPKPKPVRPTVASFVIGLGRAPANAQGAVVNATLTGGTADASLALRGLGTPRTGAQLLAPGGLGKSESLVVHFANGDPRLQADFLGYRSRVVVHLLGWLVRADQAGSVETAGDRYAPLVRTLVSYRLSSRQVPDSNVIHYYDLSRVVPDDTEAVAVQLWSTNARGDGSVSAYGPQDGPTVSSLVFHKGRVTSSFALLRVGAGVRPGSGGQSCGVCALFRVNGRSGLEVRLLGYWRKAGAAGDAASFGGRVVGLSPTLIAATPAVGGQVSLGVPDAVPSTASAVLVQLASAGAARTSILQAYPGDGSPYADQVSVTKGDAASDLAIVGLSPDRRIVVRVAGGATRIRAEVVGYID